jgi:hypothetical protein
MDTAGTVLSGKQKSGHTLSMTYRLSADTECVSLQVRCFGSYKVSAALPYALTKDAATDIYAEAGSEYLYSFPRRRAEPIISTLTAPPITG